jgi:hypothetical protein
VPDSPKKKRSWKNRTLLKETVMSDGFKLGFWLYEWNDDVALKLGHDCCLRILKRKPDGHVLMTEQIGIRVDNWPNFVDVINGLRLLGPSKVSLKAEAE